jgi:hypothetical protein
MAEREYVMITVLHGSRMIPLEVEKIRVCKADSIYGDDRRVLVDLFGSRVGERSKLGLTGSKENVCRFLRKLADKIEAK